MEEERSVSTGSHLVPAGETQWSKEVFPKADLEMFQNFPSPGQRGHFQIGSWGFVW